MQFTEFTHADKFQKFKKVNTQAEIENGFKFSISTYNVLASSMVKEFGYHYVENRDYMETDYRH